MSPRPLHYGSLPPAVPFPRPGWRRRTGMAAVAVARVSGAGLRRGRLGGTSACSGWSTRGPALDWLEAAGPSIVATPACRPELRYRCTSRTTGDKVTAAWRGGDTEASIADYRTEKDVRPTQLITAIRGGSLPLPVADAPEFAKHTQTLIAAARSITHLGWGVDMVAGNATVMLGGRGERNSTASGGGRRPTGRARTPRPEEGRCRPWWGSTRRSSPPLERRLQAGSPADRVPRRRLSPRDRPPAPRTRAAFRIVARTADDPNPAFDTARSLPRRGRRGSHRNRRCVRGVARHVAAFVYGHTPDGGRVTGEGADRRFMYLPLPTINAALGRVEMIRRVLVAAPPDCTTEWSGLASVSRVRNWCGRIGAWGCYPQSGRRIGWSSSTPRGAALVDRHTRGAAPPRRVAGGVGRVGPGRIPPCRVRRRGSGRVADRVPGCRLPRRSSSRRGGSRWPAPMSGPRYHVRVQFPCEVPGPLAVGARTVGWAVRAGRGSRSSRGSEFADPGRSSRAGLRLTTSGLRDIRTLADSVRTPLFVLRGGVAVTSTGPRRP